ncbi:TetR family transcriptional regulator [Streptomyces sp. BK022]|uniref:TetR/AcrR family transcriptional regulator n=1 Tax=Streptomyces sp. BK022 TaxID=2512123 RepID=UPI0010293BB1|nr:TetR/AcrR family transcriptional regulator [Streptomyces sp. BK022]RZU36582.1 TetR family transcriptional regulator [Streptomyces sp. BK022]
MARPRSFDETEVLARIRDTFWSTGYAATSIDEIAAAAGLGKGSLYGAFGTKEEMYRRVFAAYCAGLVDTVRARLAGSDSGALDRVREQIRTIARATGADTALRGCLLAKGAAERSEHDTQVAEIARRTVQAIGTLLTQALSAAQRAGDISADADPARLGAFLLSVMRGIEALGKAGTDPAYLDTAAETALGLLPLTRQATTTPT